MGGKSDQTYGSDAGAVAGGIVGSIFPVVGTAVGAEAGSLAGGFRLGVDLGLGQNPLRRFKSDILADAQLPGGRLEQVAHHQALPAFAQDAPRIVDVLRLHFAARLVVLHFERGAPGHVRGPAKLLPWRILHTIDPIERHRHYIVSDIVTK